MGQFPLYERRNSGEKVMERYTYAQFITACQTVLGQKRYETYAYLNNEVSRLCTAVAEAMLLNELECSDTNVLRVIQVTAYNLWRGNGCHNLNRDLGKFVGAFRNGGPGRETPTRAVRCARRRGVDRCEADSAAER